MRRAVLIVAILLTLSGSAAPAESAGDGQFRVTLYFLVDGGQAPLGVRRTVSRTGYTPVAREALEALLEGPTEGERRRGLTTAIRSRVRIRSFSIPFSRNRQGQTARIDFAGLPRFADPRIGTQISRTLIGVSDIASVRMLANGRPWAFPSRGGGRIVPTWDYDFLVGLWAGGFKAVP